jgi:murein DD-endopeptidase MepM/ murein hydrolase activator NlpD
MRNFGFIWYVLSLLLLGGVSSGFARDQDDGLSPLRKKFAEFPKDGLTQTPILPTPNDKISDPECAGYAARTPGNETYGKPGWTRNFGGRFHKGVDILPTKWTEAKEKVEIEYVDNRTRKTFTRIEPVKIPKDEIYAILDGTVVVENINERKSGYGKYVILEHKWADGSRFLSMYCHLARVDVDLGDDVKQGDQIGLMGQTSNNSGGRRFLKAIPHMHFEVGRVINDNFASTKTAKRMSPPTLGGKYDPRNMQPYNPIEFLKRFKAITYSEFKGKKDDDDTAEKETREKSMKAPDGSRPQDERAWALLLF